jgi:diaminohydroxyphosphoribosylaminopyrimidine deaminase/5-amino-6-(5-phosphoribosylamino)uracil reductase
MVGAVLVKDGAVVGEGFHPAAGQPHAEVFAIADSGVRSKGATAYVTLEPCCHQGRTPPCTDALINAGVSEVFIGMLDPDERVSGNGVEALREAGIQVHLPPLLESRCRLLNEAYIKHRTTGLPLITLKSAMSLDGRIATSQGDSKWITGEKARQYAHKYRAKVDAIMVGAQTVRSDDPSLSARVGKKTFYPTRVIVSMSGCIPLTSRIFKQPGEVIVVVGSECDSLVVTELENAGARILQITGDGNRISMREVMRRLGEIGILSILIEGGGELSASCLQDQVVDRVMFYYAPKIIGGKNAVASIGGYGVAQVSQAPKLTDIVRRKLGDDLLVEGYVSYSG